MPVKELGGVELLELGALLVTGILLEILGETSGESWVVLAELDHGTPILKMLLPNRQVQPSPWAAYRVVTDKDGTSLAIVVAVRMLDGGFPVGFGLQLLELGQAVSTLEEDLALVVGGT